jgi:hypothetical protein
MAISEKLKEILDEMLKSGSSETTGVADILKTIAENGGDQDTDSHIVCCAKEIRNAADDLIKRMMEPSMWCCL